MRLAAQTFPGGPHPTVVLHGFLGSGRNLASLVRRWAQADPTRTFLVPDLTGHGQSPAVQPSTDLTSVGRDVLETARAEGLQGPLSLVGHSFGGRVALALADAEPGAVSHVTLLDISPSPIRSAGGETTRILEALNEMPAWMATRDEPRQALLARGIAPPMVEWLLTNLVPSGEGYAWRIDRAGLQEARPRLNAVDLWSAMERFGPHIRCIRGGRSSYVSEEDAARMRTLGCSVSTIADAGHFLHVDRPQELLQLLLADPE